MKRKFGFVNIAESFQIVVDLIIFTCILMFLKRDALKKCPKRDGLKTFFFIKYGLLEHISMHEQCEKVKILNFTH